MMAMAAAQHAQAQVAYDASFTNGNVTGTAIVTTNGTGSNGNVADDIAGSITADSTVGTGVITGLSNFAISLSNGAQNIQATQPYVSANGLAFSATNGASYNIFEQSPTTYNEVASYHSGTDYPVALNVTVHPSVDTNQASYDENSAPLQQSTIVFEGGTFKPTTGTTVSAPVMLSSYNGGGTLDASNGIIYMAGPISGPGGLTITGSGGNGVALDTANSYTGGTTIDAGGVLGIQYTIAALPGDVVNNGGLEFEALGTATYTGSISGAGQGLLSSSTLTVTGDNAMPGGLVIFSNGSLQVGSGGSTGTWTGDIGDGGALIFDRSGTVTYGGVISDDGTLTMTGGGTLVLTGHSTFSGATTIDSGSTIQLGNGTAGHNGTLGTSAITDNGLLKFDYSGSQTFGNSVSGSGSAEVVAGTLVVEGADNALSTGTVTIDSGATMRWHGDYLEGTAASGYGVTDNGLLVIDYSVSGGSTGLTGSVLISGSGALTVHQGQFTDSAVNTYTGLTTIDSGGLFGVFGGGSISASSGVQDDGIFDISAHSGDVSIKTLSGSGQANLGSNTLVLTAATGGATGTFSGVIQDGSGGTGGGLEISGGTEILTGANTYTGGTTIDSGATLALGDGTHNGTAGSGDIADNGTLKFDINGTQTFGNVLFGSGGVEVVAGVLISTHVFQEVDGAVTIDSGATLQWGDGTTAGILESSTSIVDNGALVVDLGSGVSTTIDSAISGSGTLEVKSGAFDVNHVNSYTGLTTIDADGALSLGGGGSIADSSGLVDNGAFDIVGVATSTSITTLSGSGTVNLGKKTLILTAASGTFSGVISEGPPGGSLEISGGTETLTGANTYSGLTTIDAGATLQLGDGTTGHNGAVGSGGVLDKGTLKFDIAGTQTVGNDIFGPGSAEIVAGTLIVTNTDGLSGTVTIDNGATLQWGDGTAVAFLDGHSIVDNGSLVVDLNSGGSLTLTTPVISGSGAVTVQGGTLATQAANTYSGATLIDAGATLKLSGAGSIADSSGVEADGTFDISTTTAGASIKTLAGTGEVDLGSRTLTLTDASDTFSGAISGGGSLEISGGTETLTGSSSFSGSAIIDSGAELDLAGPGAIADASVADAGTFDISGTKGASIQSLSGSGGVNLGSATLTLSAAAGTFSGEITGSGSLDIAGGTETLTGFNSYTGATTIESGATLALMTSGSLASSAVADDGALDISAPTGGSPYVAEIASLSGSGSVLLGANVLKLDAANGAFSGVIDGAAGDGGLWIAGGAETLTGVNTYQGATLISGTLNLSGAGSVAESGLVEDNGVFDISGTTSGASVTDLGGSGSVILGSRTLTVTDATLSPSGSGSTPVFEGVISGAGGLTIAGGSEGVTGINTYTGATLIDPGAALYLGYGGQVSDSSVVTANGLLDISFETAGASIKDLAGAGAVNLGGQTLTITAGAHSFTGVIAGSGGLAISGGTESLGGVNTYTGATAIASGAGLDLVGGGSIADSAVVADNGTFDLSGSTDINIYITSLAGAGSVVLGTHELNLTAAANTFSGVISGAGLFYVAGGTETLSGVNTYTGGTGIAGGATLKITGGGSIASGQILVDNGTLDISGASGDVSVQQFAGTGVAVLGANTLVVTAGLGDEFAGEITGAGGFRVAGGSESLGGVNTYTGQTTIDAGATLKMIGQPSFTSSIATSSGVVDNGTFDISGQQSGGVSITTLSGSGNVVLGADTLTLTASSGDFSGAIAGTGGLIVAAGVEILSGTNPFTGGVTIAKGASLQLGHGGATGSLASAILDNGLLTFDLGSAVTYGQVISGSGAVTIGGTGPITFSANNTYSGGTTINPGATLKLGAGGTSGWAAGDIVDTGTLVFNRSDTVTEAQVISGAGALVQSGPGTLILDGVNTVSGQTTVSGGVLEVGDAAHPGAVLDSHLGGVLVNSGGTLAGHGTINGAVTNNGHVAPGGTIGTLTVASYTQGPGGALDIEVSPTAASQLKVIGAASIAGTLNLNFDPGTYTPQLFTVLTAGSLTGTFSTINRNNAPAGVVEGVAYTSTGVILVGEATDGANVYGEVSKATLDRAQSFASMVEDSFGAGVCANGSNAPHDDCNGMRAWAKVIGSSDHTDATSSGFAFTNKGAGALGGIDKRWGEGMTLGVAFGYTENNLRITAADASASGRSYYLGAYGRWQSGQVQFDGQGFWMKTDWPLRRAVQGFGTASSNPDGDSEGFLAQLSAPLGASGLRPYVRFTYAHVSRDATSESGVGMLGFDVKAGGADAAVGEAGFIFAPVSASLGQARVFPTLRLGVQQDFASRTIPVAVNLGGLSGTDFTTTYVKSGRTTGVADAAIRAQITSSFDLTADVRGRLGSGQSEGAASVGGVIHF